MSAIEDYDLRNIFKFERKLLVLCGIYPNEGSINRILYNLSTIFHISLFLLLTLSMLIFLVLNIKNMLSIVEAFLYLATETAFFCKLFNAIAKRRKLLEIENILTDPAFYRYSTENKGITEDCIGPTKMFAVCYRFICVITTIVYVAAPLLDENKWALPLSGWNPVEVNTQFKYWTIFTFQFASYSIGAVVNSSIDILISFLITIATSQFEILKHNLSNIKYDTVEANREFSNNVVLHYTILRLVRAIEDTFSYATFSQLFSSVVVICFTLFEMMILPPNSAQYAFMCGYFGVMSFQVGMYCWFGHNIIASSDKINGALYMSNWYEADLSLKKSIMIFMERCKTPVILTAGKIFPLSLITFTSIMRSSYSYLAVLQSMYGQE